MPHCCAVVGCGTRGMRDSNSFFRIPASPKRGTPEFRKLKSERRQKWIAALKRADMTDSKLKNALICDKHFITGRPAAIRDINHPDWFPSQNMGYPTKQASLDRFERTKERQKIKCTEEQSTSEHAQAEIPNVLLDDESEHNEVEEHHSRNINMCSKSIQTDLSMEDIKNLEKAHQDVIVEICALKQQVNKMKISEETFIDDDKRTKYYTGLPTFSMLLAVFDLISADLSESSTSALTKFQQFMLTLMHLRLNLPFADLAYRFNVSNSTVSRYFYSCLFVMWKKLKRLVIWPEREDLKKTMPRCFREAFSTRVTLIMDCFEIFVEKPSNVLASAQVWSNYKHKHTVKYLIAICPQGSIIFTSYAWGGKTSDKELTLNSGILDKLLPGDLILADRGFLINDAVGLYCAEVMTPSFTKGQRQLGAYEIEKSRKISNVRIHVERVIGTLRQKYTILSSTLRTYILSEQCPGEVPAVIDQIVTVCCALCNICPSVVPLD